MGQFSLKSPIQNWALGVKNPTSPSSAPTVDSVMDFTAWTESARNGQQPFLKKIITVKFGDNTKRIGTDANTESIKDAIKSAFRLRTKKAFWLEDEEQIVQPFHPNMPLGNYTLHVDEGIAVRVCQSDDLPIHQEDMIFYTEEEYRDYLDRQGWLCLREHDGFRNINNVDDLKPGVLYRGIL